MLFHHARQGKKGLYLTTLSEPSLKLVGYMQQFSFFDAKLIAEKRMVFADLGWVLRRKGAEETLAEIMAPRRAGGARDDGHRQLQGAPRSPRGPRRGANVHLRSRRPCGSWGAASLFVGEYSAEEIARFPEFAIADGIIRLGNRRDELARFARSRC